MTVSTSAWNALLIGGCSGTGKTTLARVIARHFDAALAQVDDFRMALQRATSPKEHPSLHYFISSPGVSKEGIWRQPPDRLCEALMRVSAVVSTSVEVVVEHHVAVGSPLVLEGDGVSPVNAAKLISAEHHNGQIRAVFLDEPDEDALLATLQERWRESAGNRQSELRTQARTHWLFGQWLVGEAKRLQLPVIPSRPWNTLSSRVLAAIG